MQLNEKVSITQLADYVGISKIKIIENINKLKMSGLVDRIGSSKGGNWLVHLNVTQNVTQNRLVLILNLMQNDNHITTEEIAEKLKLTKRTIFRDLDKLRKTNKIIFVGSAKNGYWKILD